MSIELAGKIAALKKERTAVVLAHNYQRPEVQEVADFTGDSLGLSMAATKTSADVIIFCGVDFMAESALILNPSKIVVMPTKAAVCPMAAMITKPALRELKAEHPGVPVVSYVNTSAAVKAESDYCCTSSNAVKVVNSLREKKIIFTPDRNLGLYVQRFVKDKELVLWPGYCPTHQNRITVELLSQLKREHPLAEIIVHPECAPEVIDIASKAASTEGMLKYCRESPVKEFIVGTEQEHAYRLRKENPGKTFYTVPGAICPNMKKTTLELVARALETLEDRITLPKDIIEKARVPLDRMVAIGRGD
ncbi:MAG: quinolinate synthase NadA [Euryarchaeota archaeon]|nr:quinolinate synthase NadA [Euryarchaeota archaeon]